MAALGRKTYHKRFLSAEGCYSYRAAYTAGLRIKARIYMCVWRAYVCVCVCFYMCVCARVCVCACVAGFHTHVGYCTCTCTRLQP